MELAKENCFSIRGGSEEKISFLHYGKAFNKQKGRNENYSHDSR